VSDFVHSSESNEHYTPPEVVEAARTVLGKIELDPFSCDLANEIVGAEMFYGVENDGFTHEWFGRVFCNPPGGKVDADCKPVAKGPGRSSSAAAWAHLMGEYRAGRVHSAIFVGFNLEVLRLTQACELGACLDFPCCYPRDRLHFWGENVPFDSGSPQYPNVLVYVPPRGNHVMPKFFRDTFSQFGKVVLP
jgi:hypothetical protein